MFRFRGFSVDSSLKGLMLTEGISVKIRNPDGVEVKHNILNKFANIIQQKQFLKLMTNLSILQCCRLIWKKRIKFDIDIQILCFVCIRVNFDPVDSTSFQYRPIPNTV